MNKKEMRNIAQDFIESNIQFEQGQEIRLVVAPENVDVAIEALQSTGEEVAVIGKTVVGKGVILK